MAMHGYYYYGREVCDWCGYDGHSATFCPESMRAQQYRQAEINSSQGWDQYSQNYDQGWSPHPDSSWSDSYLSNQWSQPAPIDPYYPPPMFQEPDPFGYDTPSHMPPPSPGDQSLEATLKIFLESQGSMILEMKQSREVTEAQVAQLRSNDFRIQPESSQLPSQEVYMNTQFVGESQVPPQPDQFDQCFQPSTYEEPDPYGYGSNLDYLEMNARDQQLEQTITSFMQSQSMIQAETSKQLEAFSAQLSQLSTLVSQTQREEEHIFFEEASLDDQFLEPSPELTCQGSVSWENQQGLALTEKELQFLESSDFGDLMGELTDEVLPSAIQESVITEIDSMAPILNGPECDETLQPQPKLISTLELVKNPSVSSLIIESVGGEKEIESESQNVEEPQIAAPTSPVPLPVPEVLFPLCLVEKSKNDELVHRVNFIDMVIPEHIDMVIPEVVETILDRGPLHFYFSTDRIIFLEFLGLSNLMQNLEFEKLYRFKKDHDLPFNPG